MTRHVYKRIAALLDKRYFRDGDELYLLITLLVSVGFAFLVHVALCGLFLYAGMAPMLRFTLASLVIDTVCAVLVYLRFYAAGGILLTVEVAAYSLITIRWLGAGSCGALYLPLVLMLQFLVPYASKKARVFMGVVLYAAFCAVVCFGVNLPPMYGLGRIR
ncbi:MAG: hypothetical protein LBU86_00895, partial [Oscillospiraceae bacterium]|nr:hypothetical protein [Oscillospiraceae bacterium]